MSEIAIAMRGFKSDRKDENHPTSAKEQSFWSSRGSDPTISTAALGDSYKFLTKEIEVVVTVMTALRLYLDALAKPIPKHEDKVKRLGESLRRLDVGGCEKSMKECTTTWELYSSIS